MNFEVFSFQMIYNLWLLKYSIGKKDSEKESAKRPTGGTVTVKGLRAAAAECDADLTRIVFSH